MEKVNLNITYIAKTNLNAKFPTRGSENAAGYDLYACLDEPVTIQPGETVMVGTGVAIALPKKHYGMICARSGLATKHGIALANGVGICDRDYRGEYIVALHNFGTEPYTVNHHDRIAQVIFQKYCTVDFEETTRLRPTKRGSGGFGSTGIGENDAK